MCPKCIQCHKKIHVLNHLNSLNPKKNLLEFETADYRNSVTLCSYSRVPSVKKRRLVIEFGLTELHTANFGFKR